MGWPLRGGEHCVERTNVKAVMSSAPGGALEPEELEVGHSWERVLYTKDTSPAPYSRPPSLSLTRTQRHAQSSPGPNLPHPSRWTSIHPLTTLSHPIEYPPRGSPRERPKKRKREGPTRIRTWAMGRILTIRIPCPNQLDHWTGCVSYFHTMRTTHFNIPSWGL